MSDFCTSATPELHAPVLFDRPAPAGVAVTRGEDGRVWGVTVTVDGAAVAKAAMLQRPRSHLPQRAVLAEDVGGAGGCSTPEGRTVVVNGNPGALSGVTVAREPESGAFLHPLVRVAAVMHWIWVRWVHF